MNLTLFDIEQYYNEKENDLTRLYELADNTAQQMHLVDELEVARAFEELKDVLVKAKCYDIERLKRSQGGKKSSHNMTTEQRRERARKAGRTKKKSK